MSVTANVIQMEGVQHLYDNLYRVRTDLIEFAEGDGFTNPRYALGVVAKPKGFSKEEMDELREAIRTEGLDHPLICRYIEGEEPKIMAVNGERRLRCIRKLVQDDQKCYQPSTDTFIPASELYEYVECRLKIMSDREAYKHAFSSNERAIGIGEGATVAQIGVWRKEGWTDDEILETTGKSVSWLRETDVLLNLDEQTLAALANDEIKRSAALKLAKIEDVEQRIERLNQAREAAEIRLANLKEKIESEIESTEIKMELAEARAVSAEFQGDEESAEEAKDRVAKLKKKALAKRREKAKLENGGAKVSGKDVARSKAGKSSSAEESGVKPLTRSKIQRKWLEPLAKLIKAEGKDEEGNDLEVDLEDAHLFKLICTQIEKGETDPMKILRQHARSKAKRAGE